MTGRFQKAHRNRRQEQGLPVQQRITQLPGDNPLGSAVGSQAPELPHAGDPWPTPRAPPLSVHTCFSELLHLQAGEHQADVSRPGPADSATRRGRLVGLSHSTSPPTRLLLPGCPMTVHGGSVRPVAGDKDGGSNQKNPLLSFSSPPPHVVYKEILTILPSKQIWNRNHCSPHPRPPAWWDQTSPPAWTLRPPPPCAPASALAPGLSPHAAVRGRRFPPTATLQAPSSLRVQAKPSPWFTKSQIL